MSTTYQPYSLVDLEQLQYDDLQERAIKKFVETDLKKEENLYRWSDGFDDSHGQTWVLFGYRAYELLPFRAVENPDYRFEYIPLLIDGKMIKQFPDEGKIGVAYLMRLTRWKGVEKLGDWWVSFMELGWLHKDELKISKDQIVKKLQDEGWLG